MISCRHRVLVPIVSAFLLVNLLGWLIGGKRPANRTTSGECGSVTQDFRVISLPANFGPAIHQKAPEERPSRRELPRGGERRSVPIVREEKEKRISTLLKVVQWGEQAEAAFEGGNFIGASSLWRQVLAIDPMNQPAQEGLQKLEKVAGKLYEEALMMKGSDQSREKIQIVLALSEPGSELHSRAQTLMHGTDSGGGI